jgi:D-glycero-alpha-D-manno-heptose-7-phosphate kinase
MIITRTPFRISLFGGGTDYPEWFTKNTGQVVSMAINKYCHVTARYLPPYFHYNYRIRFFNEQKVKSLKEIVNPVVRQSLKYLSCGNNKIELVHHADLPGMSGLGGSSAFTVGLLNALKTLKNHSFNKKDLAMDAIHIERDLIKERVGYQDQIICSYGGLRSIRFLKNKNFSSSIIKINQETECKLENNLFIVYTGLQRFSEKITNILSRNMLSHKNDAHLHEISAATIEGEKILKAKNLNLKLLAEVINFQWDRKKKLAKGINNKHIDEIYNLGLSSGSYGAKLLGAGGGGFLLFVVPDNKLKNFKKAFHKHMYLQFKIDHEGSKLLYDSREA